MLPASGTAREGPARREGPQPRAPPRPAGWGLAYCLGCSLVAQRVKRPPAMQETRVQSLGQEDPLEKEMAIHSGTLAWRIPWMEEPGGHHPGGRKEWDTVEQLHSLTHSLTPDASHPRS